MGGLSVLNYYITKAFSIGRQIIRRDKGISELTSMIITPFF